LPLLIEQGLREIDLFEKKGEKSTIKHAMRAMML
jgi:hypothetical protein